MNKTLYQTKHIESIAKILGYNITKNTLVYWQGKGLIEPIQKGSGTGSVSKYNIFDLMRIVRIAMLKEMGFELKMIKKILERRFD